MVYHPRLMASAKIAPGLLVSTGTFPPTFWIELGDAFGPAQPIFNRMVNHIAAPHLPRASNSAPQRHPSRVGR